MNPLGGISDGQKIGALLSLVGILLCFLGVLLFFDSFLLTTGNILVLAGIPMAIGLPRTRSFLLSRTRLAGTLTLAAGVALVLLRRPTLGILVQGFGFINLFGDFFPYLLRCARCLPVIGPLLSLPPVAAVLSRLERVGRAVRPAV